MPFLHHAPVRLYLGPQLIGAMVNTVLFTLEAVSVIIYYRSKKAKKERKNITLVVLFNLAMDTVGSFAVCASAYTFCVIYWGNEDRIERPHWSLIVNVLTNSISSFVVQGFLTYRYWRLSSNKYTTIMIFGLMLFALGGALHLVIVSADPHRQATDRLHDTRDVTIALAGSSGADIAINVALTWTLYVTQTFSKATKHLVRRIMTIAIVTGAVTSFTALVVLISFLIVPLSRISTCFTLFLGRIYTLTMLYILIHRDTISHDMMNVVVDSDTLHSTDETACNRSSRSRPFSLAHSDGIVFARQQESYPSIHSHSTPDLSREYFPKRIISRHSEVLYNNKNDSNF